MHLLFDNQRELSLQILEQCYQCAVGIYNANCCNIVTRDGRELAWTNVVRYLGYFIESASYFKCSLDNAKRSFYRSFNGIFGRVGRIA